MGLLAKDVTEVIDINKDKIILQMLTIIE